jgi:hypothetical protein
MDRGIFRERQHRINAVRLAIGRSIDHAWTRHIRLSGSTHVRPPVCPRTSFCRSMPPILVSVRPRTSFMDMHEPSSLNCICMYICVPPCVHVCPRSWMGVAPSRWSALHDRTAKYEHDWDEHSRHRHYWRWPKIAISVASCGRLALI